MCRGWTSLASVTPTHSPCDTAGMSLRCPGCGTVNAENAWVCTMCKRVLRRAPSSRPPPPGSSFIEPLPPPPRTPRIELAEWPPTSRIELADVPRSPRRPSFRPPAPDAPGTNPYSAKRLSSLPPPAPDPSLFPADEAPAKGGPYPMLRGLASAIAMPLDRLVAWSTRPPYLAGSGFSPWAYLRLSLAFHLGGAFVLAAAPWRSFTSMLAHKTELFGGMAILLAISFAARWWIERTWDRGGEPSAFAVAALTFLPWVGIVALVVAIVGSLLGELHLPEEAPGLPQVVGVSRSIAMGLAVTWLVMVASVGTRNVLSRG